MHIYYVIPNFKSHQKYNYKVKEKAIINTWIMPLMRQTPRVYTTMWASSGWRAATSFLTSSTPTLWSVDNRSATTIWLLFILPPVTFRPRTALESPRFATYNTSFEIAPTRQHEPTDAIWGLASHDCFTKCKNSSSVALNAFFITSADNPPCSDENSEKIKNKIEEKRLFSWITNTDKRERKRKLSSVWLLRKFWIWCLVLSPQLTRRS